MAALQYKAEHNKVGYLLKPTGSDDYHNIIDFLRSSHIRYALTANLIIFDSLVKQFWSTATLRAPELGPPAIMATIDRIPYIITEDLVRSSLQLANDGGLVEIVIFIVDSGCSKHMTRNLKLLINFVKKFLETVKFRNHQIAPILGYGDLVQGAVTIKRGYYVKGLNHNLFSVGQFCDADLEVAFRK
nr:integrase, catalytic region, zinc finger, CCHC-type, peptidase aspartic, catalytic [Tanacetum cinerariifolium]